MKRALLAAALTVAAIGYAKTRSATVTVLAPTVVASPPTSATAGIALQDAIGCRMSIRVVDAGTINGGTLIPYYYDANLGWTRPATSQDCTLEANKLPDGGPPAAQVCADMAPLARFGRVMVYAKAVTGGDGGSPNGFHADGGQFIAPTARIECWGPNIMD